MQADRHHPARRGAVLVEHVELVDDHPVELLRPQPAIQEGGNVVDLDGIGDRDQRAGFDVHRIGLLVIDPVADIFDAVPGEDVGRVEALAQRRAEPALRCGSGAFRDGGDDVADQPALLVLRLVVEQHRVGAAMPHPFPAEIVAGLDDAGVLAADLGVEGDRALDSVALHHLHHAPDADPHPEIAPRIVQHVGLEMRGHRGDRCRGPVPVEMLDIGDHPDRDPRAVREAQRLPVDDRRIIETSVFHGCLQEPGRT